MPLTSYALRAQFQFPRFAFPARRTPWLEVARRPDKRRFHPPETASLGGQDGLLLHIVGRKRQRRPQVVFGQMRVAASSSAKDRPASSLRKISSTVIRVPLMQGLPIITAGSAEMRACGMRFGIRFIAAERNGSGKAVTKQKIAAIGGVDQPGRERFLLPP